MSRNPLQFIDAVSNMIMLQMLLPARNNTNNNQLLCMPGSKKKERLTSLKPLNMNFIYFSSDYVAQYYFTFFSGIYFNILNSLTFFQSQGFRNTCQPIINSKKKLNLPIHLLSLQSLEVTNKTS